MAKKKNGKIVPMLSPEKYIRQKARSLEIFDCRVNTEWNKTNVATGTVARRPSNDYVTVGLNLAELNCFGIKDFCFMFNITICECTELLQIVNEFYSDTNLSDKLYLTIGSSKRKLSGSLSDQFDNNLKGVDLHCNLSYLKTAS
jgi:hypothetical protein